MHKRTARIYWFPKSDEPDVLIFDAGYQFGDIHIYEHKETLKATELEKTITTYGHNQIWDLVHPGGGREVTQAELQGLMRQLQSLEQYLIRILRKDD